MKRKSPEGLQSTATMRRVAKEEPSTAHPVPPDAQAFSPGDVIAGRYRVLRFMARGGMGEVYAAEDLTLHESVALKTIRPALAATQDALQRFKRELRLARRVTHAHVCRVFDLGEHVATPPGGGPPFRLFFLTMELLAGETVQAHLARHGPMAPAQVLRLAEQMAAALDAAHSAHVIHRDFKSSNVMLVPTPSVPGGLRAVVTDFGLALGGLVEGEGSSARGELLVGSPAYMSPEQVEGLPVSPASDLYSLGVVLFEMLTGRLPFVADTAMAAAVLRLHQPPPSLRDFVPTLEPAWDAVLARCMARQPEARFATASEAVAALRQREPVFVPASGARVSRRVVAVLAPRNLVGRAESQWLSTALSEMFSAELAVGGQVRVLSGEGVARMRQDLSLPPDEGGFAPDTLRRMRVHSGVDLVLTGAYLVQGEGPAALLRLDLRIQDASSGETVTHLTEVGAERELLELVSRTGASVRERLGLTPLTPEQARGVRGAMPQDEEAARLYAEGLTALRSHDAATAAERFEGVVAREPAFAPAHSALAAALQYLFQEEPARECARRAFELSGSLSREERLLVAARHHEARSEWPQAIETYQTLFEFFPDNLEYGIALVFAQVSAGQSREAQATLESLRRLPAPLDEDARIELAAAVARSEVSDFTAAQQHAAEAVARARRAGQGQLAASALIIEAYAARNLGAPQRAVELMEESERLFLAGGDRGGAARSMLVHAMAFMDLGRLREAERVYASAIHVARELRGASLEAELLQSAGGLSCRLGRLSEALQRARRAEERLRERGRLRDANACSVQQGLVLRHLGELDEARRLLERGSHSAQVFFGDDYIEAWARHELGCVLLDLGEPKPARQQLERALELRRTRGLWVFVAETELALAELALADGRWEEALALAEWSLAAHAELRSPEREGLSCAVKARALLALGEQEKAREALERAGTLAGQSEDAFIRAELVLSRASLVRKLGTPGEREETVRELEALSTRSVKDRMKRVELEARLFRVELSPRFDAATAKEAKAIRKDAYWLGYRRLADRADALGQASSSKASR